MTGFLSLRREAGKLLGEEQPEGLPDRGFVFSRSSFRMAGRTRVHATTRRVPRQKYALKDHFSIG